MSDNESAGPARVVILGGLYCCVSACLICYNKYILHQDIFPFPEAVVVLHMFSSTLLSVLFCLAAPSFYPTRQAVFDLGWIEGAKFLGTKFVPLGIFFAGTLVLSNHAVMYCSIAFLQMLKEANIILVWVMSYAVGLEVFNFRIAGVLLWTLLGATIAAYGEVHFILIGFIMQISSQVFECAKIVGQNLIMDAAGFKMDPMTTVMFMAPCCLLVLTPAIYLRFDPLILHRAEAHWPLILGNCLTAFVLNVVVSMFIKCGKGLGFILVGIIKDILIVSASSWVFHTPLSLLQILGFHIALFGIFAYGLIKMDPRKFDNGILPGLYESVMFGAPCFGRNPKEIGNANKEGYGSVALKVDGPAQGRDSNRV